MSYNIDPHGLSHQVAQLSSFVQRWSVNRSRKLSKGVLTFAEISVLYNVRFGVTSPGEIAKRMQVTPKAITRFVDQLEGKGMLVRHADPIDKRRTILTASSEGADISARFERDALSPLSDLIADLPQAQRQTLADAVVVLNDLLARLTR